MKCTSSYYEKGFFLICPFLLCRANNAARNHQTTVPLPPSTAPALSVVCPPLMSIAPNPVATDPFDLTAEISALSCDAPVSILDIDDISEDSWIDEKGSSALDTVSIYKEKMDVPIIATEKSKRQETIIIEELFTQVTIYCTQECTVTK